MSAQVRLHQARIRAACGQLRAAFEGLRGALHHVNLLAGGIPVGRLSEALSQAVANANRALARAELLLRQQERLARQEVCPRCQGEGHVTERGPVLSRVRCPSCGGSGWATVPRPRRRARPAPRGRWQHFLLTRLLDLGGASWPVPLRRLWGARSPGRAERAAVSRALAALERRGLLRRSHGRDRSPRARVRRATRARLTARGAKWAQALTNAANR